MTYSYSAQHWEICSLCLSLFLEGIKLVSIEYPMGHFQTKPLHILYSI